MNAPGRAGSLILLWLLALSSILASACSAPAAAEPVMIEPVAIRLTMRDHYFVPERITIPAGERVRLELVNEGQIPHAVMVGLELQRLTWEPSEGLAKDFFQAAEMLQIEGNVQLKQSRGEEFVVQPRSTASLVFTAPAAESEWEIGCMLPGHYETGMRGTLLVQLTETEH